MMCVETVKFSRLHLLMLCFYRPT